ncbi:MAG TPA: MBL fold metallo-hydrolase [Terriglobales bacterium]|jgi:phosphoribosyl 1,2-cyclic phosphodiesterase|nr:MBL fold metallo-hydrolase [Terriglobales bacterium]
MISLTVLASGSRGNCSVLASSRTRILVDAGVSCREIGRRMQMSGDQLLSLSAVIISHEHSDHVAGLYVLARKLKIPVFMTGATYQAWQRWARDKNEGVKPELQKLERFEAGRSFTIGDITVAPFTIPHDAADPVGFTFRAEGIKIGVATDLGYMPASVADNLSGCDTLVIESNHDVEMLRGGPYPWVVKQRVMSRVGHLSNDTLAQWFAADYDGNAAFLVLAHLSEQNNHPDLARRAAERALAPRRDLLRNRVLLASQHHPLETIRL